MRFKITAICLMATSCTSPYPTSTPAFPLTKGLVIKNHNEKLSIDNIKIDDSMESSDYERLADKIKLMDLTLKEKTTQLANQKYSISDIGFLGGLTSVIAAASGAITTALYSGGVAVGGNTISQRYNYDVQILNYNITREKLNCMYKSMTELNSQQQKIIINDTNNTLAGVLKPYVDGVLNDLEFELEKQQTTMSIVAPDISVVSKLLTKEKASGQALKNNKGIRAYGLTLGFNEHIDDAAIFVLADNIEANIGLCKISPNHKDTPIDNIE